jgi:hypothetical protein
VDELIKVVSDKTGLDQNMARQAAEAVIGFLKERMPEPMASQIDGFIGGGGAEGGNPLGNLPNLGGFGG